MAGNNESPNALTSSDQEYQYLEIINEAVGTIEFALPNNSQNDYSINLLKNDPATEVNTQGLYWTQFKVNMDRVGKVSKFRRLKSYKFGGKEKAALRTIRLNRNGVPSRGNKTGRIQIDFKFDSLYGWFRNGRTRSSKNLFNHNDRRMKKQEIALLKRKRDDLTKEKILLRDEIATMKSTFHQPQL